MNDSNIVKVVVSAVDKASKVLDNIGKKSAEMQKKFGATASALQEQGAKMQGALGKVGSAFTKAGSFALKYTAILAGVAAAAVTTAATIGVKMGADMEQVNVAFTNMYGSADKAKQVLTSIADFAAKTPFEFPELADSALKLKNIAGITDEELIPALTNLGDIASSQAKPLSQAVEAYNDAIVGEFERLKEFGIRASSEGDKVTFTFKGVQTTVNKTSDEIGNYIRGIGQMDGVAGSIEKQSQTWKGLTSTLKDGVFFTLMNVVGVTKDGTVVEGGLFDRMKAKVADLIAFLDTNQEKITSFISKFVDGFVMITDIAFDVFDRLQNVFSSNSGKIQETVQGFVQKATAFWEKYGEDIIFVAQKAFAFVKNIVETTFRYVGPFIEKVMNTVGNIFKLVAAIVEGDLGKAFEAMKGVVANSFGAAREVVKLFRDLFKQAVAGIGTRLGQQMSDLWNIIVNQFNELVGQARNFGKNMVDELVNGIKSKMQSVEDAARKITERIAAFVGFSSPTDEGPGANADKWMPNMMTMLAGGIIAGLPMIAGASGQVATEIESGVGQVVSSTVWEEINAKHEQAAEFIKKYGEKAGENYMKVSDSFTDMQEKVTETIHKLDEEYETSITGLKDKIITLADSFKELKKSFSEDTMSENKGLASAIVEQKDLLVKMREEIDAKKAERDAELQPLLDEFAKTRNKDRMDELEVEMQAIREKYRDELAEMEKAIQAEGAAYGKASEQRKQLSAEIAEEERRNQLTGFERYLEDRNARQQKRLTEFEEKRTLMQQEATELITQQTTIRGQYETTRQKIVSSMTEATNTRKKQLESQSKITETETQKMVTYYQKVTEAINKLSNAKGSVGFSTGGIVQKYATGGVARSYTGMVFGRGGVDKVPAMLTAGEVVLNAAQQKNLASALSGPGGGTVTLVVSGNNFYGSDPQFVQSIGEELMKMMKKHMQFESFTS